MKVINRIIVGAVLIAAALILFFSEKKENTQPSNSQQTAEAKTQFSELSAINNADVRRNQLTITSELKKCFNTDREMNNLEDIYQFFEKTATLSNPSLDIERYHLIGKSNEKLIVEHMPNEELKNKVRLFKINPADEMPDRIWNFSEANNSEINKRLEGALSEGSLIKKIILTHQSGDDGESLLVEREEDKIISLVFNMSGVEFRCSDQQTCNCTKN